MIADVLSQSDIQSISGSDINHENIAVKQLKYATMHQAIQEMGLSLNACSNNRQYITCHTLALEPQ